MTPALASILLLLAPAGAQPEAVPAPPVALAGEDFLLIQAAAAHPEMRRSDLACYTIHIGAWRGLRSVTFMAPIRLATKSVPGEPDTVELVLPAADPPCRDTTFLLDGRRDVVKIYHDLEEVAELLDEPDEASAAPRE
ncbi:MAG TPA: hypothetical protein VF605_10715 [Allosphingosinicella sp.]|jgi:hypothetical protein